jgi:hypothetical protein
MRTVVVAAATALLAACGGTSATSSASPSPTSAAGLLSCRLPVTTWIKNGGTFASQSGFVAVPSGTFAPDPAVTGSTYDRAYRRWLPVVASYVLPDGSAYAYEQDLADGAYEIHMVDVASGADKMDYHMPYDNAYSIVALKPEGVYLVPLLHRSGIPTGLWLLSSTNATVRAVAGAGDLSWQVIDGGAAWGRPVGGDSLDRLDLSTGVVTTWFRHAVAEQIGIGSGNGPEVVGFDLSGRPLIEFAPAVAGTASPAWTPMLEVWLVSSPGQANKLTGLPLPDHFLQAGVTDTHGTWLVGLDGFYLYTDGGFHRAAPMPPGPVGDFAIAGGCA